MKKKKARIVVVGSANVDLTTFTDKFPKPGETLFGKSFDLGFGGKGANQAVAAAYCGADAHMVARVGDDLFGPATIKNFKSLGIGAKHVKSVKGSSGVAPIFVEANGQNRILVVKGANDKLTPKAVNKPAFFWESQHSDTWPREPQQRMRLPAQSGAGSCTCLRIWESRSSLPQSFAHPVARCVLFTISIRASPAFPPKNTTALSGHYSRSINGRPDERKK